MRVAPHVGAWIEIPITIRYTNIHTVAPHVGAWIEICILFAFIENITVAPHVGAWIEICRYQPVTLTKFRRTPRGCVD